MCLPDEQGWCRLAVFLQVACQVPCCPGSGRSMFLGEMFRRGWEQGSYKVFDLIYTALQIMLFGPQNKLIEQFFAFKCNSPIYPFVKVVLMNPDHFRKNFFFRTMALSFFIEDKGVKNAVKLFHLEAITLYLALSRCVTLGVRLYFCRATGRSSQ